MGSRGAKRAAARGPVASRYLAVAKLFVFPLAVTVFASAKWEYSYLPAWGSVNQHR